MYPVKSAENLVARWGRQLRELAAAWWRALQFGAQMLVLSITPSSYAAGERRQAVLRQIYAATAPLLTWFLVLSALISLVLIRIVVATATSYGLSQYALEVLVRTLVLELIPLYAALFVAVRYAMPGAQRVRQQLARRQQAGQPLPGRASLAVALFPHALAGVFSVVMLASLSGVLALLLTYFTVYGFSPWGWPAYTHAVGGVFTPAVSLIFGIKTLLFSLAVAVVPLSGNAQPDADGGFAPRSDMAEFARLFSVLLLIEVLSLVGNYY